MYEWEINIGRRIHETCKEPNPVKTYRMVEKDIVKAILEAEKLYMKEEEKDARDVQVYEAKNVSGACGRLECSRMENIGRSNV